jgi:demethoxyubiquinone hydroxylase (CLK1/Coq7/Cat5 family)
MEEEETYVEVTIEPKLHDRWSLLNLAVALAADLTQTIADNLASAAVMSVEHAKQKHYDREFGRMTDGNTRRRSRFL